MREKLIPLLCGVILCSVSGANAADNSGQDIMSTIKKSGDLKYMNDTLKHVNLDTALTGPGPYTVFAPSDNTFDKMGLSTWTGLWGDVKKLKRIVSYGIVRGDYNKDALTSGKSLPTLEGHALPIAQRDNKIYASDKRVKKFDIKCSNGVIHIVDGLLKPPAATASSSK